MTTSKLTVSSNLSIAALFTVLAASLSLNVALGIKAHGPTRPRIAGVARGSTFNTIAVQEPGGAKRRIRLDDGRWSVLYIMSPSCVWCARNLSNIRTMAKSASKYRFIGLSNTREKLDSYVASGQLPFPVYAVDKSALPKGLDVSVTPQTVVIGPNGKVDRVWIGALDGKPKKDAEQFFKVPLPGLASTKKKSS